jgi:glucose-6-phosphate isomerase
MQIQFDHTNLLADMVGRGHGVTRSQVDRGRSKAVKALRDFQKKSEAHEYGFPHLPFQQDVIATVRRYAAEVQGSYDTVCLAGIGGSALGAWALDCGIRGPHPVQRGGPRLVILDNVDPAFTSQALDTMNPKKTLVLAIAKSGSTAETAATFLILRDWLQQALGRKFAQRVAAVTTEGKGDLYELSQREGYRTFFLPENVGGRFSVLSAVGLLPAALIGIDVRKLAKGAADMTHLCWQQDLDENLALRAALYHWLLLTLKNKPIQVAFPYSNHLWGTAFWFRQLWAESLGKARTRGGELKNIGQTPVAALGTTDQHSQVQLYIEGPNDKVFTFWTIEKFATAGRLPKEKLGLPAFDYRAGQSPAKLIDAERRATAAAMTAAGRPNCAFRLGAVDAEHFGAFLQMMEFETAFMGELLDINAFDQEGVELGKKYTFALMGRRGFEQFHGEFDSYEEKRSSAGRSLIPESSAKRG